jgi:hypothetical protein
MNDIASKLARGVAALTLAALLCTGTAARAQLVTEVSSGAFRNAAQIEMKLRRGISTKADVAALIGVPNGTGGSLFPQPGSGPREIWYYEDIAMKDIRADGQSLRGTMKLQMILVFFNGEVFDGFLWTAGADNVH